MLRPAVEAHHDEAPIAPAALGALLLTLTATLVEPLAEQMVGGFTPQEWRADPAVTVVEEAAALLEGAGRDVPTLLREAVSLAAKARAP